MAMDILGDEFDGEDVMARAAKAKRTDDQSVIERHVSRFKAAGTDKDAFDRALVQLEADRSLTASEIIAIANSYAVAGVKATSRASALKRLQKRFTEIVRTKGNVRIAEKARPW